MSNGETNYPGGLDDDYIPASAGEDTATGNDGDGHAGRHNDHYKAVLEIQRELGTNPSGSELTVKARIESAESATTSLDGRLDTAEAEIDALQATDAVLDGRLDTAETDIDNIQTGLSNYVPNSIINAAGDLIVGSANDTPAILSVGTEGKVLTVTGGVVAWDDPTGGSGGGHVIQDPADTPMTQRANLKFASGFNVTDEGGNSRTVIAPDFGTGATEIATGNHSHAAGDAITLDGLDSTDFVQQTEVGAANGVASLDASSKVPLAQIPSIGTGVITYVIAAEANLVDFNEIQTFKFGIANGSASDPTGGTFTLSFNGQGPTTTIAYDAADTVVESALEGLSNIGVGDVNVVKSGQGDYIVNFQGALAGTNVAELTSDGTSLTGPNSPYTITHATTLAGTNLADGETAFAITEQTLWVWDNDNSSWELILDGAAGGAPSSADYLVGTANGSLSNEIVVGATPGGELGGTWASPTVDATHAGGTHHANTNDPSAGEKAALAGTTGTPGVGNKYVTDTDTRLADSRAPSGSAGGDLSGTYPNPSVTNDSHNHTSTTVTTHSTAHSATDITNTPAGNIAAVTVQAAINELDSEKSGTSHTHTNLGGTPAVTLGTTNSAGAASTYVKTDATILTFDTNNPAQVEYGVGADDGVATVAARRDHIHAAPSITDSVSTTSSVIAASATAVKAAYDLAASGGTLQYSLANDVNNFYTKTPILQTDLITPAAGDIIHLYAAGEVDNPAGAPSTPTYIWYLQWEPVGQAATIVSQLSIDSNRDGVHDQAWSLSIDCSVMTIGNPGTTRAIATLSHDVRTDGSTKVTHNNVSPGYLNSTTGRFVFYGQAQNSSEDMSVYHATLRVDR